jgi:hypothetical protein
VSEVPPLVAALLLSSSLLADDEHAADLRDVLEAGLEAVRGDEGRVRDECCHRADWAGRRRFAPRSATWASPAVVPRSAAACSRPAAEEGVQERVVAGSATGAAAAARGGRIRVSAAGAGQPCVFTSLDTACFERVRFRGRRNSKGGAFRSKMGHDRVGLRP